MGNLDYNKLINANPKQVFEDCVSHIKIAAEADGYWLAFRCEIPRDMPYENIKAFADAGIEFGHY